MNDDVFRATPNDSAEVAPDSDLLRQFAGTHDQGAFSAFVRRHVDLVYSTALRQLAGDVHLAQDVTQSVFCDAARKAGRLAAHPVISAWLHASARFAAAKTVRSEQRRRRREGQALAQELVNPHSHDEAWARMRPVIDDAIGELKGADRDALVLRFFESCSFGDIGRKLHLSENAARMRVERALDRLRVRLTARGITSTSAALATALSANAVIAAPAGLASASSAAAVSAAASGGLGLLAALSAHKLSVAATAAALAMTGAAVHHEQAQQSALSRQIRADTEQRTSQRAGLEARIAALRERTAAAEQLRQQAADLPRLRAELAALRDKLSAPAAAGPVPPRPSAAPVAGPSPLDPRQLDRMPALIERPSPKYPLELRAAGISGRAVVELVVKPDGSVSDPRLIEASHKEFGAAALAAVQAWKFEPGQKDGRPVSTRVQVPMIFSLNTASNWF